MFAVLIYMGENSISAQNNSTLPESDCSIVYLPLNKFDFGTPNPNADSTKIVTPEENTFTSRKMRMATMALTEDDTEYAVGQIPYQEEVTPTGGRVYSVPIMVSPMSKFPPQISIQYNSQAGNGLAGYGWDIAGLSAITITNRNLYYHDKVSPANIYDWDQVYSLDGVPLVQNDSETLSSEFALETARGHILVKKHMGDMYVNYFSVLYPDGSRAIFGLTSNTDPQAVFPITFWEDKFGNQIVYNYLSTNSDYRISSIEYKHMGHSSLVGRLSFSYAPRTDYHTRYRAAQATYQDNILKSITSVSKGDTLAVYQLTHEFINEANMLMSIGCTNSSGEQLRPLTFSYGEASAYPPSGQKDFSKTASMLLSSYFGTSSSDTTQTSSSDTTKFIYRRGKFQPDNYKDGLIVYPDFEIYDTVAVKNYSSSGLKEFQYGSSYAPDQVLLVAPSLDYYSAVDSITAETGFQCLEAADVDGDGVDEIVKVNFDGISGQTTTLKITVYEYNAYGYLNVKKIFRVNVNGIVAQGETISPAFRSYYFGKFKGDGKTQLLTFSYNPSACASLIDLDSGRELFETNVFTYVVDDEIFCVDMDGDGMTELGHITKSGMDIYNLFGNVFAWKKTISGNLPSFSKDSFCTDFNGDGCVDVAVAPEAGDSLWRFYCYDGYDFSYGSLTLHDRIDGDKFHFFDVNNDDLPDLVAHSGTSVTVYINDKGTFSVANKIASSLSYSADTEFIPCNMVGYNSMSDFITVENCNINVYSFSDDLKARRLLNTFTNSLGAVTVNNYADMVSSRPVYDTDSNRTYSNIVGYAKSRFPMYLLYNTQSYLSSSHVDALSDLWYTYYDACSHTKGLGFCGFGKTRIVNFPRMTNSLVIVETRDPENMGVTIKVVKGHMMTLDNPYDITEYSYDSHSTTYGKRNPRLIRVVQTDTLTSLNSTTIYTYDSYDYPTSIEVQRRVGSEGLLREVRDMTYIHEDNLRLYSLGNLMSDTMAKIKPEGESGNLSLNWIEKQEFMLDRRMQPVRCIVSVGSSSETLNKKQETHWEYDMYGNVIAEFTAPFNVTEFVGKEYVYDAEGINVLSATNEFGQTTTFGNYNKYGKPLSMTDYAGRVTTMSYDGWGNMSSKTLPDGTVDSTALSWGGSACYTVTKTVTGKPAQIIHYDSAEREVRSGTQRFDSQWVFKDRVYGILGQVAKESLPFKGNVSATLWNTYEYDEYLRPVSCSQASGNVTTWSYSGNSTTESKNGIWSIKTVDSNGEVVMVQDAGGTITYDLRPDGQPSLITVNGVHSTSLTYDEFGRRTQINDPSAGIQTSSIVYSSEGNSVSTHTNPNGSIITHMDIYGRTTKIERPGEYTTDYVYNSDNLLVSEISSNGTSTVYAYDGLDRVVTVTETVPDGKWLRKTYTYTAGSNLSSVSYESQGGNIATENFTYQNGSNIGINLFDTPIRVITAENEFGQPTSVTTGGIYRTYSYNSYGIPTRRTMGDVMDNSYSFDPLIGNLLYRTDNIRNQTESFGYDALNRLVAIDDRTITYSAEGNITSIDGVGDMSYGNISKPYQVTSLTLEDNVVPSRVQNVTYTCYSRPSIITEGGRSAAFTYNGAGDRVKMNVSEGVSPVLMRYYIGGQYEVDVKPSGTTERLYLGGDAYTAPMVYVKEGNSSWTLHNIGRDYLGNITHIATSNGTLVEENSYDPWGRLRNPETQEIYTVGTEPDLKLGRGYTGHEHLTWFGLINMNARLYDPVVGRFLSPDPFVQASDFTQSYNRYSYCLNNPLVYVDESGELVFTTAILIGMGVGALLGAYQGYKIAERKGAEGWEMTRHILFGSLVGGTAGAVGGIAGAYVGSIVSAGGFVAGFWTGAAAGATSGFINGFGMSLIETPGNYQMAWGKGFTSMYRGALSGALLGGMIQGTSSALKGENFWNGSSLKVSPHQKGVDGVNKAIKELQEEGYTFKSKEVTIECDGTRARIDLAFEKDGQIFLVEVKNGPHAGFTPNQEIVYPAMSEGEYIVPVGKNALKTFGQVGKAIKDYVFFVIIY